MVIFHKNSLCCHPGNRAAIIRDPGSIFFPHSKRWIPQSSRGMTAVRARSQRLAPLRLPPRDLFAGSILIVKMGPADEPRDDGGNGPSSLLLYAAQEAEV